MPYLSFISDNDLIKAVSIVVGGFTKVKGSQNLNRNSLDPFGALFECANAGMDYETWRKSEQARQSQKTIQNKIGEFHQSLFGSLSGCVDVPVGKGLDILNIDQHWCAEVKNKHNTTKGNHLPRLYDDIVYWVDIYSEEYGKPFTGYYVQIIPNKPANFDSCFTPSDRGQKRPARNDVRKISAALLYEKVTGIPEALKEIYMVLPRVLSEEFGYDQKISAMQLGKLFSENILK